MNIGGTEKSRGGPGVGGVLSGLRTSVFFHIESDCVEFEGPLGPPRRGVWPKREAGLKLLILVGPSGHLQ